MPGDGDQTSLYRLVLDHGDFGIHNMSITIDKNGQPLMTSLYNWETGYIVPAILSDPLMAVTVDLVTDEITSPSITRLSDDATPDLWFVVSSIVHLLLMVRLKLGSISTAPWASPSRPFLSH